ncbi:MAG: B12-binding domain-containing radical SAM protein [Eubacterium sp.]|nr:B12-binding domain-containing radical SAM protein [Eubacterium sp.]
MRYEGSVYRPPSEAYSLIVQITVGCSHNGCTFCNMYKEKKFHIHTLDEVLEDLAEARSMYNYIDRIFLADGDALIYKTEDLISILDYIKEYIPECRRVSSYATPRSLLLKTQEELDLIRKHGLAFLYLGLESGCDEILKARNKGATSAEIVNAGQKAKKAGYDLSVTILSGLGGKELMEKHALDTAKAISEMKPDYIGEMTLNIIPGTKLYEERAAGSFVMPEPVEILEETKLMIKNIDDEGAVFRSNHISNYVNIRGTFNEGREDMIRQIDDAIKQNSFKVRHYTNM